MVLKVSPPLVIQRDQVDQFAEAAKDVVDIMHSSGTFWNEALGLAQRALRAGR